MTIIEQPRELLRPIQEAPDFSITFLDNSDRNHPKKIIVHIPFDDLPKVGKLLNSFLQSNGIQSYVTEE